MMERRELDPQGEQALEQVLGYLNFSTGNPDSQFLGNLNLIFGKIQALEGPVPAWRGLLDALDAKLAALSESSPTFQDSEQSRAVLTLIRDNVLPGYREYHRDLLFHQPDEALFGPFFIGRVFEAILRQGGPWTEADRITRRAIKQLTDYVGHRPIATLESQNIEI
jgi:hypothetical protein